VNRILLDQGLPRSAAAALREVGWNVEHVSELGMSQSSDRSILDFARTQGRTVVTLDADFHALLAVANESGPSVVRIRQEGLKGREIAALLLAIWSRIESQIQRGAMVTVTEKTIRVRNLPLTIKEPEI
jgi:predicted nuclease of predicted toxin-antitoxin system